MTDWVEERGQVFSLYALACRNQGRAALARAVQSRTLIWHSMSLQGSECPCQLPHKPSTLFITHSLTIDSAFVLATLAVRIIVALGLSGAMSAVANTLFTPTHSHDCVGSKDSPNSVDGSSGCPFDL